MLIKLDLILFLFNNFLIALYSLFRCLQLILQSLYLLLDPDVFLYQKFIHWICFTSVIPVFIIYITVGYPFELWFGFHLIVISFQLDLRRYFSHLIHRVYCIFGLRVSSFRVFLNLIIIFLLQMNLLDIILLDFDHLIINQPLSYQSRVPFSNWLTSLSSVLLPRYIQRLNIYFSLLLIQFFIKVLHYKSACLLSLVWYLHELDMLLIFPILVCVQ